MASAQQFEYPLGTIAVYGPDNTQATKLVASVLTRPTRSFREFAAGVSPDAIVKTLNREGVAAPFGGTWSPGTIHGNAKRGTGILNNELYVGRMVWNRLRHVKNRDTGKRVSRLNPASDWIAKSVPELRTMSDEMWDAAKERQKATRRAIGDGGKVGRARRPRYLFSGPDEVRRVGSGFIMAGVNRLSCFGARYKGICARHLMIRRDEVDARVLTALQEKLVNQELFEELCDEFTREMNRLRIERRAELSNAEREIDRIEARRQRLIEMVMDGVPPAEVKDEMIANAARRDALNVKAKVAAADEPPPLLHPERARIYRTRVTKLAEALQRPESRVEATETLRGLVDAIVLSPAAGGTELAIELRGNLAAMLGATAQTKGRQNLTTFPANIVGGGGPQPIVPAALLGGSVNVKTLAFLTEVTGARRRSLG